MKIPFRSRSLRALGTVGMVVTALLPSFVSSAHAYPPPCQRGDIYVGADTFDNAQCLERKFLKIERAQMENVQRRVFTGETTRTLNKNVRKVYMHPTNRSLIEQNVISKRNVIYRRFPVEVHLKSTFFPVIEGTQQASLERKDTRVEASLSFRTRRAMVKKLHRENPKQKISAE